MYIKKKNYTSLTKKCNRCLLYFERNNENFFKKKASPDGLSTFCKKCDYQRKLDWNSKNPEKVKATSLGVLERLKLTNPTYHSDYRKSVLKKVKEEVFSAYGNKCACCGETNFEFLSIDHVNGDGHIHRAKSKKSSYRTINMLNDIINQNFPATYQVLCYNCHFAKDFYGKCPHINGVVRLYEKGVKRPRKIEPEQGSNSLVI